MSPQRASQTKVPEANQRTNVSPSHHPPSPAYDSGPSLLQLHSMIGNRAMGRILQAKLKVNEPGDEYEREADQVAEMVMRMPEPLVGGEGEWVTGRQGEGATVTVQRKCAACASGKGLCPKCAEEEEKVQRKPLASRITPVIQRQVTIKPKEEDEEETTQTKEAFGRTPTVSPSVESHINSLRGGGQPLFPSVRAYFESRFGFDFSQVRVHAGARAAESARTVNALAYTVGRDVVFGAGEYAPETQAGKQLLAHELVHIIQQRGSPQGLVQRDLSETQIRQRIAENERQIASPNLSREEVLRLNDERNRLAADLQRLRSGSSTASTAERGAGTGAAFGSQYIVRPPGLPLQQGYELAQATDVPPEWMNAIPEGQLVQLTVPQTPAASNRPGVSGPVVALAEKVGQGAGGAEAALLASQFTRPGGLLGSYSPFARVPTEAEAALIRAGRAFHFTPTQNVTLIQQPGGTVLLRPSTGLYRNLLTPYAEPSAYAFLGQPSAAQQAANLAGRGALGQQALVVIEGADLPPGTLFRPLDRTIVMPRGYQGPGVIVEPGGQMPLPLRAPGTTGGTAAVEGAAAQQLTRFQVLRWGGRIFIVVGIAATAYEIASAPPEQRARTAVGATSGFLGGLAGGAAAGLLCGPGAPLCSVVFGLTLGIAGALTARAAAEGIYDVATRP